MFCIFRMKSLYQWKNDTFFLLFILLNNNGFAQKKKSPELEVINFKSKFVSFYNNGANEDFGQEFKMIFFKDYIIFEQPIHHLKGSTFHVDSISVKDGDTTYHDNSAPDMTIVKVTYMYYVFKKGEKRGLFYDMDNNKSKPFSVDTLYIESNLGSENEADVSFDLGKPDEVKKRGKKWSEKYYNFKSESGRDTVFRYYDDALTNIPFSLSKKIDQEKKE